MSHNVGRLFTSILLVLIGFFAVNAQTSADVMRERVAKAKAFIAVRNYNAAIYELENIRRETSESTVHSVINVLLMNSYLEQGDYKRAQDFLTELSNPKKINQPGAVANYSTVAAQVIKGARTQLERYRSLGLSVADRNLPVEAASDVQKMRETLELVVEQSKTLGKDKDKTAGAMAILEEATNARSSIAKDDYDANRWKNEAADARENLASSRSVVINAVIENPSETSPSQNTTAVNNPPASGSTNTATNTSPAVPTVSPITTPIMLPVGKQPNPSTNTTKPAESENNKVIITETAAKVEKPTEETKKPENTDDTPKTQRVRSVETGNTQTAIKETKPPVSNTSLKTETPAASETAKIMTPLEVGSLVEYATSKQSPVYPPTAKSLRMTGVVRVELVIDETGLVAKVQNTSGPTLLQRAATDAIKKWKFKPFMRDGEPVKALGFVSFNFNL